MLKYVGHLTLHWSYSNYWQTIIEKLSKEGTNWYLFDFCVSTFRTIINVAYCIHYKTSMTFLLCVVWNVKGWYNDPHLALHLHPCLIRVCYGCVFTFNVCFTMFFFFRYGIFKTFLIGNFFPLKAVQNLFLQAGQEKYTWCGDVEKCNIPRVTLTCINFACNQMLIVFVVFIFA